MEELRFASTEEAIQYLADETGQKIIVADMWTKVWTTGLSPFLEKEYKEMKNEAVDAQRMINKLGSLLDSNSSLFHKAGKGEEKDDIIQDFEDVKNNKSLEEIKSFTREKLLPYLIETSKSKKMQKIVKESDARKADIKEMVVLCMTKIPQQIDITIKKRDKLKSDIAEEFKNNKTQKGEDTFKEKLISINKAVNEELTKIYQGDFGTAIKSIAASVEFSSEEDAIQHLSDLTGCRVVISK
jgi:hypothetical protein